MEWGENILVVGGPGGDCGDVYLDLPTGPMDTGSVCT